MSSSGYVCRVCLASGVKMHGIKDIRLLELYEKLSSAKFITEDGMPNTICYICIGQLQRCSKFSNMARKSEKFLKHLLQNNLKVTSKTVASLNIEISQNLSINTLEAVSFDSYSIDGSPLMELDITVKVEPATEEGCFQTEENSSSNIDLNDNVRDINEEEKFDENIEKDLHYNCDECKLKFTTKNLLIAHLRFHDKKSHCKKCNKLFSSTSSLQRHESVHTGEKPYVCHKCSKSFRKKDYLRSHIKVHVEKPFLCNICNANYTQSDSLKKHMQIHKKGKPYACNSCTMKFSFQSELNRHTRIHTGERPYTCKECKASFTHPWSLKKHMSIHIKKKPYACHKCQKRFALEKSLKSHRCELEFPSNRTLIKQISQKPHVCESCNAAYTCAENLNRHMRIHSKENPYACDICDKKFTDARHLKGHMRIHTGEKPYVCDICNVKFTFSNTLTKHMHIHNKDYLGNEEINLDKNEKKSMLGESTPQSLENTTARNKPICQICKKRLFSPSHLIIHMRIHTGERPFPCDECHKSFSTKSVLKSHKATHTRKKRVKRSMFVSNN